MSTEKTPLIHNMSAPPVSKISIGGHRKDREIVEIKACGFPENSEKWERSLANHLGYTSPCALIEDANALLLSLFPPPISVTTKGAKPTQTITDPLLAIAILPRCIGHLFMIKTPISLQYRFFQNSVCFSGQIAKCLARGEK